MNGVCIIGLKIIYIKKVKGPLTDASETAVCMGTVDSAEQSPSPPYLARKGHLAATDA